MILVEKKVLFERKNYLNMVIKQNWSFKFFNNINKNTCYLLKLNSKKLFNSSFNEINNYNYLFSFIKKFRKFKLITRNRFRGNRLLKLKLNSNLKLRIKFISKIRYRNFPITISRFNILRSLIAKNYHLRILIRKSSILVKRFKSDRRYKIFYKLKKNLKKTKISSNIFLFFLSFRLFISKIKKLELSKFGFNNFNIYNSNFFKRNRLKVFKLSVL